VSKSKIDWTDETVNFLTGCRGPNGVPCTYCYARKMAKRLGGVKSTVYARTKAFCGDEFSPAFHNDVYEREKERLTTYQHGGRNPGYTVRQRRVFLSSMGDVCFEGGATFFSYPNGQQSGAIQTANVQTATAKWCERVGAAGHTCLILTKRPDLLDLNVRWPANVHLGVSVTSNVDSVRIAQLLTWREFNTVVGPSVLGGKRGPSVLWTSVEPLIGDLNPELLRGIGWVVVGLQSGPGAALWSSPMKVREQCYEIAKWCRENGIPAFFKESISKHFGFPNPGLGHVFWPREYPK